MPLVQAGYNYTVNIYLYCLQYYVNSEFAVGDDSDIIATLKSMIFPFTWVELLIIENLFYSQHSDFPVR